MGFIFSLVFYRIKANNFGGIMEVSIIIVNYNAKDLVPKCIDSIFLKTVGLHYEVIVIDNCSTDGSVD